MVGFNGGLVFIIVDFRGGGSSLVWFIDGGWEVFVL